MEYHPDRYHSAEAQDMFIRVTEAYEYLTSHPHGRNITQEEVRKNYEAWVTYRQAEARKRAEEYAKTTYRNFTKSPLYRSTTVIDGTMVFLGLGLAVTVLFMTVFGYFYRHRMAATPEEEPSVSLAIVTFTVGIIYLVISLLYMSSWLARREKRKKRDDAAEKKNQESV
jgi:heme/copper-type cytochrome/quinol oxidase subunit 2